MKFIFFNKKFLICFLIFILFAVIPNISAMDMENTTCQQQIIESNISSNDDIPDVPDLIEKRTYNVTPVNINFYFDKGSLNDKYEGDSFIFSGTFDNLGVLSINCNDINITGDNAYFKNTAFNINSNKVVLNNISFNVNKNMENNNGAVIIPNGEDIMLSNLQINFTTPSDVDAYAILVDGYNEHSAYNLKIINSTINFEAHNNYLNKYNCPIRLTCVDSLIIENNIINASFPLKNINYYETNTIDSNYVCAIGLEQCYDFIIKNNTITATVNKRPQVEYPSLNGVLLSKSVNGIFVNNSIYMADFITLPGVDNYLYGLDVHELSNLLVMGNNITIVTTGGKLAAGTAYPIQISGPASSVNITRNYLYSYSNGPNIGIYSQNFFGSTEISMTYNVINVTGLAGTHEWALVTGIESQDSSSEIMNNIIEVHSVNSPSRNDNLYAISYRQSTTGLHSYNIQNNLAFSDGYYAVHLLSSDNSIIINNTLVSYNDNAKTGENSYSKGSYGHKDDQTSNNVVYKLIDYYKINTIVVEDITSSNSNSLIDGSSIAWNNQNQQSFSNNPIMPYYSNNNPLHDNTQTNMANNTQNDVYRDDGSVQGSIEDINPNSQVKQNSNEEYVEMISDVNVEGLNVDTLSNTSKSTPSAGMSNNPLSTAQSSHQTGQSQSVSKKVFELEEANKNKEKFIPSVFVIIIAMALLIIGFRRKSIFINK